MRQPIVSASEVILIPSTVPKTPATKIHLFCTSIEVNETPFRWCNIVVAVFLESLHLPIIVDRYWSEIPSVHLPEYHYRMTQLVREVTHG